MPRIRNVKPSIWKHEVLHDAEYYTGLPLVVGFISLWTSCDREGRFKWKVRSLKSDCMPLRDDVNFGAVLDCLNSLGLVTKLLSNGEYYGVVDNFVEHQAISTSEKKSGIIDLSGAEIIEPLWLDEIMQLYNLKSIDSSRFPEGQTKDRLMPVVRQTTGCQTKDKGHRTKDKGQRTKDEKTIVEAVASDVCWPCLEKISKKYHEDIKQVLSCWSATMGTQTDFRKPSKANVKRAALIKGALAEGYVLEDCLRAIDGCLRSPHHMGKNDSNTVYNEIHNIFNEKNFEKFIRLSKGGDKPPTNTPPSNLPSPELLAKYKNKFRPQQKPNEIDVTPLNQKIGEIK